MASLRSLFLLACLFAGCSHALYDNFWSTGVSPGDRYRPPQECRYGCALWADLASDGNTANQTAVNLSFRDGVVPVEAGRKCAMPAMEQTMDPAQGPRCFCRNTSDNSSGLCLEPLVPTPSQINLQYESESVFWIGFTTFNEDTTIGNAAPPVCELSSPTMATITIEGITNTYIDPGSPSLVHFMHFVRLANLSAATTYNYRVKSGASNAVWSEEHSFTTRDYVNSSAVQYSVFGDMGVWYFNNMELLEADIKAGNTSLVVHLGDHAYQLSLPEGTGTRGDHYMNEFERVLTRVPWNPVMGNHEYYNDAYFMRYLNQTAGMAMGAGRNSGSKTGRYYSVDHGLVHLVTLDFNVYYGFDTSYRQAQLAWLEQDLAAASAPEQRAKVPWIQVMAHQPVYCTAITYEGNYINPEDEFLEAPPPYSGCVGTGVIIVDVTREDIEPLLLKYGVDLFTCGHEHNFEATYPVKNGTVTALNFSNPTAPVFVVTGSGGAPGLDLFGGPAPWTRVQHSMMGYSRITVHNHTHLTHTYIANFMCGHSCRYPPCPDCPWPPGGVVDEFTIVQHNHGPFV